MSVEQGMPRRLHPGSVVLAMLGHSKSALLGLPAIVAVASGRKLSIVAILLVAVALFGIVAAWLRWRSLTYMIDGDQVVIASGIVGRSSRSIPLERIQDVSIAQGPLARMFGLAVVTLETGGGEADEASLDSVSLAEAQRLRATLRGHGAETIGAGDAVEMPAGTAEAPLFAMPLGRVLHMGLYRFSLVWIGLVFAAFQTVDEVIGVRWRDVAEWAGANGRETLDTVGLAGILATLAAAILVGAVTGVVRTLLTEYGFRLTLGDGRFRRTRGLTTRTEIVVPVERVQLTVVRRGWLSGRFGWRALEFQSLGGSFDPSGRHVMAPFADQSEIARIGEAVSVPRFEPGALRPVSSGHTVRMLVRRGLMPLVAVAVATIWTTLALFGLLAMPLFLGSAVFARRCHRYGIVGATVQVSRGMFTAREWVVPLDRIQVVALQRTVLQHLLGTASVRIDTAGGGGMHAPHVDDLRLTDAEDLMRELLRGR